MVVSLSMIANKVQHAIIILAWYFELLKIVKLRLRIDFLRRKETVSTRNIFIVDGL